MTTTLNPGEFLLRLRIQLLSPPPDVIFAVQKGKADLIAPVAADAANVCFEIPLRLRSCTGTAGFTFMGDFAHGPPQERFVYINSGIRAGQANTPWERRAKLKLAFVPEALQEAAGVLGKAIEASFTGTARDGGPVCASVPLAAIQWRITQSTT